MIFMSALFRMDKMSDLHKAFNEPCRHGKRSWRWPPRCLIIIVAFRHRVSLRLRTYICAGAMYHVFAVCVPPQYRWCLSLGKGYFLRVGSLRCVCVCVNKCPGLKGSRLKPSRKAARPRSGRTALSHIVVSVLERFRIPPVSTRTVSPSGGLRCCFRPFAVWLKEWLRINSHLWAYVPAGDPNPRHYHSGRR